MNADFTVRRYGTDVYGRPIFKTAYYHEWEQHRWANLGFDLPIAQGAFMLRNGGGAAASSHAHDYGGCVDYIIDHLNAVESEAVVREFRKHGGGAYRRGPDAKHGGMPTHLHNTLGTDRPMHPMAQTLWSSYLNGGDGLAAGDGRRADAPDYEWRPNPLVTIPPPEEDDMTPAQFAALLDDKAVRTKLREVVWGATVPSDSAPDTGRKASAMLQILERLLRK
ncbi:MAG: hypothetical protein J7518_17940 [Nocardioidaceae bacterium]|nr:hypothetical protein [Nocardioidaceae bacterium]